MYFHRSATWLGSNLGPGNFAGKGWWIWWRRRRKKGWTKKSTLDIIDIFSNIAKLDVLCPWEFCLPYFHKIGVLFMRFFICFLNVTYQIAMKIKQYKKYDHHHKNIPIYWNKNKGIRDAGSTADFRILFKIFEFLRNIWFFWNFWIF